jgi:phosphopantetheinyl transferase (holo-ACP synthase)
MPHINLPLDNFGENVFVLLWHATEKESELLDILAWSAAEIDSKRQIYTHKSAWRQHLASRALLKKITELTARPLDSEGWHWSLSHSGEYSAAVVSRQKVGIDIQLVAPKIARLAARFMSPAEYLAFEACAAEQKEHFASLVWSAKEAMFKAWRQQNVTFNTDLLLLAPILANQYPQILPARAQNLQVGSDYSIYFNFLFGNYSLAIALEER